MTETAFDTSRSDVNVLNDHPCPPECPKCGSHLEDMRKVGFSPDNLRRQRVCFLWANGWYECHGRWVRQ